MQEKRSPATEAADPAEPIVIDLGKTSRKRIKQLKQGRGKLFAEVDKVIEGLRAELGEGAAGKDLVPVVILYCKKPRKTGLRSFLY